MSSSRIDVISPKVNLGRFCINISRFLGFRHFHRPNVTFFNTPSRLEPYLDPVCRHKPTARRGGGVAREEFLRGTGLFCKWVERQSAVGFTGRDCRLDCVQWSTPREADRNMRTSDPATQGRGRGVRSTARACHVNDCRRGFGWGWVALVQRTGEPETV